MPRRSVDQSSWISDPFCRLDWDRFKTQWRQILAVFIWMEVCTYLDCLSMANLQHHPEYYLAGYIWQGVPSPKLNARLPEFEAKRARRSVVLEDEGHRFFPQVDPAWSDRFCCIAIVGAWLRFFVVPGPRSMRWTIVRRLWLLVGFVRLYRALTISATVLPNPDLECVPSIRSDNVWVEALWIQALVDVTCQDVLYSEHSCGIMLMALFWAFYGMHAPLNPYREDGDGDRRKRFVHGVSAKIMIVMFSVTGFCVIIGSRFHYSDDVLIAVLVCGLCFATYHFAIRAAPFHKGLFWDFLMKLEEGSPDMQGWRSHASTLGLGRVESAFFL